MLGPEAIGAPKKKSQAQTAKEAVYRTLPVDDMIRQAAENVSRRYNLNPYQTQFTEDMMVKRVTRFLNEHEDEIWPIIRDMARYRNPRNRMDARTARRLGKAIKPIFVEADREVRLERRIERDMRERGRDRASVVAQFTATVEPGYERYTLPTKTMVDRVIDWNRYDDTEVAEAAKLVIGRIPL